MGGTGQAGQSMWSSMQSNPDLWLTTAGSLANAIGAPGVGGALTGLGGITEYSKAGGRTKEYADVLETEAGLGKPSPGEPSLTRYRLTPAEQAIKARGAPRTQAQIMGSMVSGVERSRAQMEKERERRRMSPPPLVGAPPLVAAQGGGSILRPRGSGGDQGSLEARVAALLKQSQGARF